ncbi:conserved hypothetical protein [Neospora caninum Liverpool]|nr:conserved hypothetical protein [Neospora caninum Liverpool]CBZ52852.1 conserved hypothetical protein [Neospora caninum Liverpool]|eukprot:XP_003882884.1 conserved hypothetical protein [Neospora caninum Liverpool]
MRRSAGRAVCAWIVRCTQSRLGDTRQGEANEEDVSLPTDETSVECRNRVAERLPNAEPETRSFVEFDSTNQSEPRRQERKKTAERTRAENGRGEGHSKSKTEEEAQDAGGGEEERIQEEERGEEGTRLSEEVKKKVKNATSSSRESGATMQGFSQEKRGRSVGLGEDSRLLPRVVACLRGHRTPATAEEGEEAFKVLKALEDFFCAAAEQFRRRSRHRENPLFFRRPVKETCPCPCGEGGTAVGCSAKALKKTFQHEAARLRGELATRRLGAFGAGDLFLSWLANDNPAQTSPDLLRSLM